MAISLKAFSTTSVAGLYLSHDEDSTKGRKYICRFQHQNKKYLKVLGYDKADHLTLKGAQTLMEEYKQSLIQPFAHSHSEFENEAMLKAHHKQQLVPYQIELLKLQKHLERTGKKMIILFEGRDASGKGGAIRKITRYMNNKHYRVVALGKPTPTQKTQWYFQRYIGHFPAGGEAVLFDRSWYNRAMVEPVFGFCTEEEYQIFMEDVVGFERDLTRQGIILLKLYFSVSKAEQAKRFERRKTDPLRQWKLSEIDVQMQDRWDQFTVKKYKMLKETHSKDAPWIVIRSDDKFMARLEAMKHILNSIEYKDKSTEVDFTPNEDITVTVEKELETMERFDSH